MPFTKEHAARQMAPGQFKEFRRSSDGFPDGISAIFGITPDGKSKVQSLRFDAAKWSAAKAKEWLQKHDLKATLEEASDKKMQELSFKTTKIDSDQRLVFGWLYVSADKSGAQVVDHSSEVVSINELEKAAYSYVASSRAAGVMHERLSDGSVKKVGHLVCSIVFTKEMTQALGIQDGVLPQGWFVGYKIEDAATWERVKSGELSCFSIGGQAQRSEVRA